MSRDLRALLQTGSTAAALALGLLAGAALATPSSPVAASAVPEVTVHGADLPSAATPAPVGKDGLQGVPALTAPVIDQTGTLSPASLTALTDKLLRFERERGTQMAVLVVATTSPEDIAAYAHRVADQWKIGRRDVGDGLLIVVARNDRTVRIEVARALEGAVPDLAAYRIIDSVIVPAFRAGDFAGGLDQAVDHLQARVRGENLPLPEPRGAQPEGVDFNTLVVLGLFVIPFASGILRALLGKTLGTLATGGVGGALVWLVTGSLLLGLAGVVLAMMLAVAFGSGRGRSGGWPGGGWGGGGGGGWSSGGGGSFGGAGASGRW